MRKNTVGSGRHLGKLIMTAIIALAISFPSEKLQAETRLTPSINLYAVNDDNILFERTEIVDDYVYLIEPGAGFDYDQELTKFSANGLVQIRSVCAGAIPGAFQGEFQGIWRMKFQDRPHPLCPPLLFA